MQFKDATIGLSVREKVRRDVSEEDWSRPRVRFGKGTKGKKRPQVVNGTVDSAELQRLLKITDRARESLGQTTAVTASASTQEEEWSDDDLKTPSPYFRPRNYLLMNGGKDDSEEDRRRPSKPKRPANLPPKELEALLESSSDEEEVRVVGGNGSTTRLANVEPPSSECEALLDDLKSSKNNHVPMLLAMAHGLRISPDVHSRPLADFEHDTTDIWKHLPRSSVPKVPVLKAEMRRRANKKGMKLRKNTAPKAECLRWLSDNPVDDPVDVEYLRQEETVLYQELIKASAELENEERSRPLTANWSGIKPWLRLCLCMVEDEAMVALRSRDDVMERDELDARNHINRPDTCDEVVARRHNDPDFVPSTVALPDLHEAFAEPILLPFNEMPGGALTASEVKKKITECRAKLMQVRKEC